MTKLASILVGHTSSAFLAKVLLEELLQELSKNPNGILDQLKACLPELDGEEEEEKKERARLFQEGLDRENARFRRMLRDGPWYDERNELDWRPNA